MSLFGTAASAFKVSPGSFSPRDSLRTAVLPSIFPRDAASLLPLASFSPSASRFRPSSLFRPGQQNESALSTGSFAQQGSALANDKRGESTGNPLSFPLSLDPDGWALDPRKMHEESQKAAKKIDTIDHVRSALASSLRE